MKKILYLFTVVIFLLIFILFTETSFEMKIKNKIKPFLIKTKDHSLEKIYQEATEHNPEGDMLPDEIDDKIKEEVKEGLKKF